MRTDLPGDPSRSFSAPRAHSPCRIAPNPGRAPFWPPRGAKRDPGVNSRPIRAVSTRRTAHAVVYRSGVLSVTVLAPPGMAARARRRSVLRLYRDPTDEARSPPARSACFPHPVQMSQRGVRAAVQKAHLVVYHDHTTKKSRLFGFFFGVWPRKEKKETGAGGAVSAVRRRRAPQGALGHRRRVL